MTAPVILVLTVSAAFQFSLHFAWRHLRQGQKFLRVVGRISLRDADSMRLNVKTERVLTEP